MEEGFAGEGSYSSWTTGYSRERFRVMLSYVGVASHQTEFGVRVTE